MKKILHNLFERVALRFDPGPNCEWVQERLPEFVEWDLPVHEFNAICDHLKECQACSEEEERLDALSRERLGFNTPKAQVKNDQACAAIMSRIREYEVEKAATDCGWRRPVYLQAAFCRRFLLILLICACPVTSLCKNAYSPDEFGTNRGEPISTGFFFDKGRYIDAPYVVERRGLDIYINDVLVMPGPHWALYDYKVETDPGDPPEGSSPFDTPPAGADPRNTYWSKRWRYLYSHYDYDTAKKEMLATYKKSTEVRDAFWSDFEDVATVVHNSGRKKLVSLSLENAGFAKDPPSKESILKRVEDEREFQESRLRRGAVLFKKGGLSIVVGGERGLRALDILVSDATDAETIEALQREHVLHQGPKGSHSEWIVTDFQAGPQLVERLERTKAKRAKAEVLKEDRRMAQAMAHGWKPTLESMDLDPLNAPEATDSTAVPPKADLLPATNGHRSKSVQRHASGRQVARLLWCLALIGVATSVAGVAIWFAVRRNRRRT